MWLKKWGEGLPWWLSGKESTHQCRRHRFNPWSRKISHVTEQLSPLRAVLQSPGTLARDRVDPASSDYSMLSLQSLWNGGTGEDGADLNLQ